MDKHAMEIFQKEAPDTAKAFDALITSIIASPGLDQKTKQLIYIAMKAASGDDIAVKWHLSMARELGATKAEVTDAILMTLTVSGIRGVLSYLPYAIAEYEQHGP